VIYYYFSISNCFIFLIYRWKLFIPWIFKYVHIIFAAMMTNMCLIFFMFISDKHMYRVFMHKRKIYLWVFRSSSVKCRPDCPLAVLVWVDSVVVTGIVQHHRFLALHWHWHGYKLVFMVDYVRSWVFDLVFAMFFPFMFLDVLFSRDEDGWWLCSVSVIWYENLVFGFLDSRHGFFSFGVVLLDAYLDSTWLVLS